MNVDEYYASLSPEDQAEADRVAAKAPKPTEALTARIALRFQTRRRKNTKKSA